MGLRFPVLSILLLAVATACAGSPKPPPAPPGREPKSEPAVPAPPPVEEPEPPPELPVGRNDFERAYLRGIRLFSEGELAGAGQAFAAALRIRPGSPEGWNALALVSFERRNMDECLRHLDHALRLRPGYREALLNRGLAQFSVGRYEKALDDFDRILGQKVSSDRITDYGIAHLEWQERTKRGEIRVSFPEAIRRGLLPVDREAMYAGWYRRLTRILSNGPGLRPEHKARSPHYTVITDSSEGLARLVASRLEHMLGEYERLFPPPEGHPAPPPFSVTVFARREDYLRYVSEILGDPQTAHISGGSYHPLFKKLYISMSADLDRTMLVTYHEGFHQYLDTLIGRAPPWFGEGVADYFGATGVGLETSHPLRGPALRRALRGVTPQRVVSLMKADAGTFMAYGHEIRQRKAIVGRNYALSWALIHFFLEAQEGRFRPILTRYFEVLREGGEPARAYRYAFADVDLTRLTDAFLRHARTLTPRE